jgi:hypothetical protein
MVTYVDAEVSHQLATRLLACGQGDEAASVHHSHAELPKGRRHEDGGDGIAWGSHTSKLLVRQQKRGRRRASYVVVVVIVVVTVVVGVVVGVICNRTMVSAQERKSCQERDVRTSADREVDKEKKRGEEEGERRQRVCTDCSH